ncbi:MAG: AAA family ATPase [Agathobacter sp.]|nr:AAA family ATPase [Agathobacter sp.]
MGKIVIPKNSASIEEVMGAMQIYYDANDWLSNADFIQIYKNRIGVIGDDRDSSAYTKKTEIGAYYGFIEWEDINKTQSPRRITPRGRQFLEHYNTGDTDAVHEDIMKSLEEVSFGRNNFACRSCDSDIEPPALFLRAMMDLGHLTNIEFAYLVYRMEYEGMHYTETVQEIKNIRENGGEIELVDEAKKFSDPKPILILERWGVLVSQHNGRVKETSISRTFLDKYKTRLRNLKIYNIDKDVVEAISSELVSGKNGDAITVDSDEASRIDKGTNVLLYGVPGSGKSWTIEHEYCKKDTNVERLVFHPDYTYSDFIGQILPNVDEDGQVSYKFTAGPFTNILADAYAHPQEEYILIIEEINRGNAPAIFGEVFQLLDRKTEIRDVDDDGYPIGTSEYGITNANIAAVVYGDAKHKVRIPSNLSIIGTMNTSDQNVFTLDTAFQRRWEMRLIENNFEHVDRKLADAKILDTGITWEVFCTQINKIIVGNNARMTSAEDKRLGAYFVHLRDLEYNPSMGNLSDGEYDELRTKEEDKTITDTEKNRLAEIRAAMKQNRKFPEKVIKYLWDDAFKFNREIVFETSEFQSLEQVIRTFMYAEKLERFAMFKDNVRDAFTNPEE